MQPAARYVLATSLVGLDAEGENCFKNGSGNSPGSLFYGEDSRGQNSGDVLRAFLEPRKYIEQEGVAQLLTEGRCGRAAPAGIHAAAVTSIEW